SKLVLPDVQSFNPCCDGTDSSTRCPGSTARGQDNCFNPCCDGTDSSTRSSSSAPSMSGGFQSLLMERTHRLPPPGSAGAAHSVSILVVMERTHRHPLKMAFEVLNQWFQSLL